MVIRQLSKTDCIEEWHAADGTPIRIRPIESADLELERRFIGGLSEEAKQFRFMGGLKEPTASMLQRLTTIDYRHELALVAVIGTPDMETVIGVARYVVDADESGCEFAIVVADAYRHRGIGTKLMSSLVRCAQLAGISTMHGDVLASNHSMLQLMRRVGFETVPYVDDPSLVLVRRKIVL
jgi:acetyltransferase